MDTKIISNGSKFGGEDPDPLEVLEKMLATETLNPKFEGYGNFVYVVEENHSYRGMTHIWGNFYTYSHGFDIFTEDSTVIDRLTRLIRANQETDAYKAAKGELDTWGVKRKVEALKRESELRQRREWHEKCVSRRTQSKLKALGD